MTYSIKSTEQYEKKVKRFLKRHPEMADKYQKTLKMLVTNPFHPSLRLHKLEGRLSDYHSVSINLSYRIVLYFLITENEIIPVDIGDHYTVY